jgi:hypothetical protein
MDDDTNRVDGAETFDQTERTDASNTTVRHNWQRSGQPSVMIVEAVAAATDRKTTDLSPLQETIDADALDTLLDGQVSSVAVSFRYADTGVTVTGDGSIEVRVDGRLQQEGDE